MNASRRTTFLLGVGMALGTAHVRAEVKPNSLFTEGVVLQREMTVPVWGTANEGEKVTVRFEGLGPSASTTTQGGKWMVRLGKMPAGGPYTLTISGENTVTVKNVYIGEVFLCSGQSNMEWPLKNAANAQDAIARSADPLLHLFITKHRFTAEPQTDPESQWKESSPESTPGFSAVAYFFGRKLRQELKVPVGLIASTWGGTPAEAWTSHAALEANSDLKHMVTELDQARANYAQAQKEYADILEKHKQAVEAAQKEGKDPPPMPDAPKDPMNSHTPTGLYNGMIAPLIPFAIRGAIWYQGEGNANRAYEYLTLFPTMIQDWRAAWGEGDFPFYFVQLAPFQKIQEEPKPSAWAELREAQRQTALKVSNSGMAVITDVGDEKSIHPLQKQPVGERLALLALANIYGKRIEASGPAYDSARVEGDHITIRFQHAAGALQTSDGGELKGFTIAGEDGTFVNAQAVIKGDTVIVSSPKVPMPMYVRYGWADYPVVNLVNKAGLPASPFRTDDLPFTTRPK